MKSTNKLMPFVIVTFIYFIVGFLTTINEQLQAPLKGTFLTEAGDIKNTLTTLISFFFFLGYLVNGTLGSRWVNKYGYKKTIIRGLMFIVLGLSVYLTSTIIGHNFPHFNLTIGAVTIPYGYLIFLCGSYIMGCSAAVIQVVVNPYIASYDLPGTQPVQRLNITTGINSIGTTSAPFFVTVIMFSGISIESIQIKQLITPLSILILCIIAVIFLTKKLNIPDLPHTRVAEGEVLERSVFSFRHFTLGVMAIFFYVGTEVAIGANINLYALERIKSGNPITFFGREDMIIGGIDFGVHALLSTLYWGGFLVGRAISSFFNKIPAQVQLAVTTTIATILILTSIFQENLWYLVAVGLFHSSMWSCIFSLAIKDLGKYTSKASGIFVSAVFGGAVFTLVQGGLADFFHSWRYTWLLNVACELFMLSYALFGYKIRTQDRQIVTGKQEEIIHASH
ncbi:MFS transporter [Flavobacterium luteolum]|uniref:MFS transporter n=1 Tax=Flavobacterium luteolum TaxID=3003259 RepID=UPI00248F0A6B|nr:MFS transporter [Flavobacterium luteolum]